MKMHVCRYKQPSKTELEHKGFILFQSGSVARFESLCNLQSLALLPHITFTQQHNGLETKNNTYKLRQYLHLYNKEYACKNKSKTLRAD